MDQKITNLYQEYAQGQLERREFLKRLSVLMGSLISAMALLPHLENSQVKGQIVPKDDPRLQTEYMNYSGATGNIRSYFAMPKGVEKLPGVIVISEIFGLVPHIEDITRRIALEGFLAMAPDPLTPLGGTPEDPNKARSLTQSLDNQSTIENYAAAVRFLKTHPQSTGKVGVVGFCWGGRMANLLAVNSPDVLAAVPYYGSQPPVEDVPKIKASLLLHYAEIDERINKGIPEFEDALKRAKINYRIYMYPGTQHAFNNDTSPARYNKEAAQLAWSRTIAFLKEKLK